jgi:hypothetical protein
LIHVEKKAAAALASASKRHKTRRFLRRRRRRESGWCGRHRKPLNIDFERASIPGWRKYPRQVILLYALFKFMFITDL